MFRFNLSFLMAVGVSVWAWYSDWWSDPIKTGPALVIFMFTMANTIAIYEQHEELTGRVQALEKELKELRPSDF